MVKGSLYVRHTWFFMASDHIAGYLLCNKLVLTPMCICSVYIGAEKRLDYAYIIINVTVDLFIAAACHIILDDMPILNCHFMFTLLY